MKANLAVVSRISSYLGPHLRKVSIVLNDAGSFSMAQRVPVSTEETIRRYLQQTLSQTQKIDLAKHFWTVTALSSGFYDQQGLTEAVSNKLNVLLCATRKENVEAIQSAFKKQGIEIEHIVFHVPALVKAFEFYGEKTFEDQIVGLLDLNADRYLLGFMKNGSLVNFRETKFSEPLITRNHLQTQLEIKESAFAMELRYHAPVKCVFVSGNYEGQERFINELKELRCYSRQWNTTRKLSVSMDDERKEQLSTAGARLSSAIGGALLAIESARKNVSDREAASLETISKFSLLTRPLALAACLLIFALVTIFNLNWFAREKVRNEANVYAAQQRKGATAPLAVSTMHDQIAELELFSASRHRWLPVIGALRSIGIAGVELSQVRVVDSLGLLEANPFTTATNKSPRRKMSGALVIEARNEGGLASLGAFIEAVKTNQQIRPLLNKRTTVRMLNNVPVPARSPALTNATLFSVEYLLEEKLF